MRGAGSRGPAFREPGEPVAVGVTPTAPGPVSSGPECADRPRAPALAAVSSLRAGVESRRARAPWCLAVLACTVLAGWLAGAALLPRDAPAQEAPLAATVARIQGRGARSPLLGRTVVVTAVVSADFSGSALEAFFLQDAPPDDDPATSDGLFVEAGGIDPPSAPRAGALAVVTGVVAEVYGQTTLRAASVAALGTHPLPEPVPLDVPPDPDDARAYLEAREGMRSSLEDSVVVAATSGFGEAYLMPLASGVTRLLRTTNDGRKLGLLDPAGWLALDHGDTVRDATGPLLYAYGEYKVALDEPTALRVQEGGRRPDRSAAAGPYEVSIATYNLSNLFDPADNPGHSDPRPSAERYAADLEVRARSIAEGLGLPDVVAVQEVESLSVLRDLAAQEKLAGAAYGAALIEGPDDRGIDVGVLYRRDRIQLTGLDAHQACTAADIGGGVGSCPLPDGSTGALLYGRPPLVARLRVVPTGERLTLVVNHFKSMSGDDDTGEMARMEMASHNLDLLRRLRSAEPDVPVFVAGDLNAFEDAAPLRILQAGGALVDLHARAHPADRYTYVYSGVCQVLDYILAPPGLEASEFGAVRVNVDFAAASPDAVDPEAQRASDHDPVLLRIARRDLAGRDPRLWLPLAERHAPHPAPDRTPKPTARPSDAWEPTPGRTVPAPTTPAAATSTAGTPAPASPTPTADTRQPSRVSIRIVDLRFDGTGQTEPDEYVALRNPSASAVDLTGWLLVSVRGDQRTSFPAGLVMPAGAECRVYTNEHHPEHCGLMWGSAQPIWRNSGDKAELLDANGELADWFCYGDYEDRCSPPQP